MQMSSHFLAQIQTIIVTARNQLSQMYTMRLEQNKLQIQVIIIIIVLSTSHINDNQCIELDHDFLIPYFTGNVDETSGIGGSRKQRWYRWAHEIQTEERPPDSLGLSIQNLDCINITEIVCSHGLSLESPSRMKRYISLNLYRMHTWPTFKLAIVESMEKLTSGKARSTYFNKKVKI